jgi:hypothetical protein
MGMRNAESATEAERYELSVDRRKPRQNQRCHLQLQTCLQLQNSLRHERSVDSSSTDYRDT